MPGRAVGDAGRGGAQPTVPATALAQPELPPEVTGQSEPPAPRWRRRARNQSTQETAMSATTVNGKARRSLAEQLDRLDGIIDALAEGLNETVADVVREAVTVAVQQ